MVISNHFLRQQFFSLLASCSTPKWCGTFNNHISKKEVFKSLKFDLKFKGVSMYGIQIGWQKVCVREKNLWILHL